MDWIWPYLSLLHIIGIAVGVGAATVKVALLAKTGSDAALVPLYIAARRPITLLIVIGIHLLLLTGVAWLLLGYPFSTLLWIKIGLVVVISAIGATFSRSVEPKFMELAPSPGQSPSPEFIAIRRRYLLLEVVATGLFYVIIVVWMLR